MPKGGSRKKRVMTLPAVPQCRGLGAAPASTQCRTSEEEKQLSEAIVASRACTLQNDSYKTSLAHALEISRATAAAEAEEAEALRLAVEASLADEKQKVLALGLKTRRSFQPELATLKESKCSPLYEQGPDLALACAISASVASCSDLIGVVADAPSTRDAPLNHTSDSVLAVAEAVPAIRAPSSRILKVTHGHDTRRLRAQWDSAASPQDVLAGIQTAIEDGFGLTVGSAVPPSYFFKYRDDEGDLCTLVEDTLLDFLDTALQGTSLKLFLEERPQNTKSSSVDFCIATPPVTPRCNVPETCSETIEDDYESMWSLVEVDP